MDCIYIKLDMTHPDYSEAVEALRTEFARTHPGHVLSVNESAAGDAAWAKCCEPPELPDGVVLDRALDGEEHDSKVLPDVRTESWSPTPEEAR